MHSVQANFAYYNFFHYGVLELMLKSEIKNSATYADFCVWSINITSFE